MSLLKKVTLFLRSPIYLTNPKRHVQGTLICTWSSLIYRNICMVDGIDLINQFVALHTSTSEGENKISSVLNNTWNHRNSLVLFKTQFYFINT